MSARLETVKTICEETDRIVSRVAEKVAEIGRLADRIDALADQIDITFDKMFANTRSTQA